VLRVASAGLAGLALLAAFPQSDASRGPVLDAAAIVSRSVAANQKDWNAAPEFNCLDRDRTGGRTTTERVVMLLGSPFVQRIPNSLRVPAALRANLQRGLARELARRRAETPEQRAERIKDYEAARERDRVLLAQIADAFTFSLRGRRVENGRSVYEIGAVPRQGYSPPSIQAEALTGMRGTLWIDAATFNWVRITATVVQPVSIYGFFARIEPGTSFELEKAPVAGDIWLPSHFAQHARTRILLLFRHNTDEDVRYWDYVRAPAVPEP
jgi:hypothetical protein